jgi:acetyltransferase
MTITIDGCDRVLAAAFDRIVASVRAHVPEADIKGVNVQQMAGAGREVILGLKRDPVFGPVVMVGLGGTFVEVFKDVAFRAVPMETHDVSDMIRGLRSFPLLDGARGRAKCDIAAVEDCIVRLAQLGVDCPEIQELDMNPVIVKEARQGAVVADARIMI